MNALEQSINSVRVAATAADGMKAEDVVAYNVGDKLGICDLMMIASASNERQVLAIAEEVEKQLFLKDGGRKPRSREGVEEAQFSFSTAVGLFSSVINFIFLLGANFISRKLSDGENSLF